MNKLDVVDYVNKKIEENEDIILNKISEKVAYWLLTSCKYEIDYTEIVPYDRSGEIYKTNDKLNKDDYEKLDDFLEEYNGDRSPSYCSGYGWNYDTYKEELEYIMEPIINDIIYSCFQELKTLEPQLISEITDTRIYTCEEEEIYDEFHEYLWYNDISTLSYMEKWKELSFSDIYSRGEFSAKRKIEEETKVSKYKQLKDNEYRVVADDLFNKYISLCGDKIEYIANNDSRYTGHQFYTRANIFNYLDKTVYDGIKDILNINFSKKELAILSRYKLSTTNSVKSILESNINFYDDDEK